MTTTIKSYVRPFSQQKSCRLFELPAELRNQIYELALALPPGPVALVDARESQPSRSIISTCKRISSEANSIYLANRRSYRTDTVFALSCAKGYRCSMYWLRVVDAICDKEMKLMHTVQLDLGKNGSGSVTVTLTDDSCGRVGG